MPTYEYRCPEGHTFDVFQKITDEPVAVCPECGQQATRQISGGAGFLFKGEGFYITDYRSKDYRERAKAEKPGGEKAGGEKAGEGGKRTGSGGSGSSSGGGSSPDASGSGGGTPSGEG